jgi:hypothetical protein
VRWELWRVCSVSQAIRSILFYILDAVEDVRYVLELPEVMRVIAESYALCPMCLR